MADITSIGDQVADGDVIKASWLNDVSSRIKSLENQISNLSSKVTGVEDLSTPFKLSPLGGLELSYNGGSVKLENGNTKSLPASQITVPDNSNPVYVYIDDRGDMQVSTKRPSIGFEVGKVVTSNGAINSVENYPLVQIGQISTVASSQAWVDEGSNRLSNDYKVPYNDEYFSIPFDVPVGTEFDSKGGFDPLEDGRYIFHLQVRMSEVPVRKANLSGKVSIFVTINEVETELDISLTQAQSAAGDLVLNGSNAIPVQLEVGNQACFKAYITEGEDVYLRRNSVVQAWRIPS